MKKANKYCYAHACSRMIFAPLILAGLTVLAASTGALHAQGPSGSRPPQFSSPDFKEDGSIVLSIFAPKAGVVRLSNSDAPGVEPNQELAKGEDGVWSVTLKDIPPGAYRYHFDVDGVAVVDSKNTATSQTNSTNESLLVVSGSEDFDTADVPHGAVSEVNYFSKSLGRSRRMHVYTPPGYNKSEKSYPVFYLLHGAFDCDDSWSSVGRAGYIFDNLIAAGKAQPMVVVMPHGHTGPFSFGPPGDNTFEKQVQEFLADFREDIRPFIEANYRVLADRKHRAVAGLSMGGFHTLEIAFGNLEDYAYIGVFSSGVFGITRGFGGQEPSTEWEDSRQETLDKADLKNDLLVWFGCGEDDFLLSTSDATVAMLESRGFEVEYVKSTGGHTWLNWRDYLVEFTPKLFQE